MPALVAHRGYAAKYPENTMPALRAALRTGVQWVECDVQLTADRVPVLLHDASLERTAGDARSVFDFEAGELAEISVHEPERFGQQYLGTPAPDLASVTALVAAHPGVTLFVEIKRASIERFGLDVTVGQVSEACEPVRGQCVLISFNDRAVLQAGRAGFRAGWVIRSFNFEVRDRAREIEPVFLFINYDRVPHTQPPWPGPWTWACYEAADVDRALAMAAHGFELVETRDPGKLMQDPRIAAWQA